VPALTSAAQPKRILVLRYSQSGQLTRLTESILAPLRADPRVAIHVEELRPLRPFPYPWGFFDFIDAFPESAHLVPPPLAPLSLRGDEPFDLLVLPYQVWFLAPSQPITAFLRHPTGQALLRGRPVVTVVACRNMWLSAHDKVKALLDAAGARLIDNVVLTDPGPVLATFITTPRWLLTGRQDAFWGLPAAGLSAAQIDGARRFGLALRDGVLANREREGAPLLAGLGAARADPRLLFSEKTGSRSFFLWGKLLMAAGAPGAALRRPLLALYVAFLLTLIVTLVPASLALQALLRPVLRKRLHKIAARFEQPSGSSTERCHLYAD
jgi:hypothetical protein